ncbi:uncharacterized protein BT62DRAFT_35750 [Guyanagaster necrorhizus]|uniref:DUF6534 domain-containing protein n=1 Tax=Guyanagaster necrorhizus TaxID=856835 RepID=A0A9P8AYI4_9AGAR|nr:uncharacterized protein BT62DRAFT_35750 [Guyanagaster necrorhizus MCA 3950]KAG7452929.1 hypothetical protein BT62DRAFT_35750 [Guyanagaster necrorhizus MCA 3950]
MSRPSPTLTRPSHEAVVYSLGPWFVGMCIDMLLQGVLFAQFMNYFVWYGSTDGYKFTLSVAILAIITTLKSVQAFVIVWTQQIIYFYDMQSALNMRFFVWYQVGNPLMVSLISLYVQSYFCYRLYVVSMRWWVVTPILVLYLFSVGSVAVATYDIARSDLKLGHWLAAHYGTVFASDIMLAGVTAYFLLKTRKRVLPQTVGIINALIRLTFQTATPAVICTMLNLIFTYLPGPFDKGISSAFIQALPKLYAVSMMWTLNARRAIMCEPTPTFASGTFRMTEGANWFIPVDPRRHSTGDIQVCISLKSWALLILTWVRFATIDANHFSDSESLNILSTDNSIPKNP